MCGIAGILSLNGTEVTKPMLKAMTDIIAHRGPDGEGQWVSDNKKVGLGHRRLSIIDLSDLGAQPMSFADGRYQITFNGEIYNYLEIKKRLLKKGINFQSGTDTEVLLALYHEKKEACLQDLDGMFAFAIWDNQEQTLFCARDRFGEKPFFYNTNKNQFIFASEMKALFKAGVEKQVNYHRLYRYLMHNEIESPVDRKSTFQENITSLEVAHFLIVKPNGEITKKKYWDLDHININTEISLEEASDKFYELFELAINRRLRSDVPVGSSLSGGLDSSAIVMMINRIKNKKKTQKTFSARFKNFDKDEGEFINEITGRAEVDSFFTWPDESSFMNNLQKIYYHQEEPFQSTSLVAQWEVMRLARSNNVPVLLDGQGADETLAGYHFYFEPYFRQVYLKSKLSFTAEVQAYEELHQAPFKLPHSFKSHTKFPTFYYYRGKLRQFIKPSCSPKEDSLNKDFIVNYSNRNSQYKYVRKTVTSLNEALAVSSLEIGLPGLLRYADRNAMAHSIEIRLPFTYHKLVEFLFSLPAEYKIQKGWTKYILRKSMQELLPNKIAWRKDKIGYIAPQEEWLSSPKFKEILDTATSYLKKEKILKTSIEDQKWQYLMAYLTLTS